MMGGAIFSDVNFHVAKQQDESGYNCTFNCWSCDTEITIRHAWPEVRRMLEGHHVPGVIMDGEGWIVEIECTNYSDGCMAKNKYRIRHAELEEAAEREAARRQRMSNYNR